MKKLVSILVIISMLLSMLVAVIPVGAVEVGAGGESQKKATVEDGYVPFDENGDGEIDSGVFKVTTVAEFKSVGSSADKIKAYLANDLEIEASGTDWNSVNPHWFSQNVYFDGCGNTITFKAPQDASVQTNTALFNGGFASATINIKNLNVNGVINSTDELQFSTSVISKHGGTGNLENVVVDVDITVATPKNGIAGIWGKVDSGCCVTMKDVHFIGDITVSGNLPDTTSSETGYGGIGGFIGFCEGIGSVTLEDCSSTGTITYGSGTGNDCGIGGFIGTTTGSGKITIKNCENNMNITAGNTFVNIGGFVGRVKPNVSIEGCTNNGDIVFGDTSAADLVGIDFGTNVGGIIGHIDGANDQAIVTKVKNCKNTGDLSVLDNPSISIGGIVGYAKNANISIDACQNSGVIMGRNANVFVDANGSWFGNAHAAYGGIIGTAGNQSSGYKDMAATVTNCSNSGKIGVLDASRNIYTAGIMGRIYAVTRVEIADCSNSGEIDSSAVTDWSGAAGILGSAVGYSADYDWTAINKGDIVITGCANSAKVTSGVYGAGILGSGYMLMEDDLKIDISYCTNTDTAQIYAGKIAGGIVGYLNSDADDAKEYFGNLDIKHCVNGAAVTSGQSSVAAGGILGYTNGDSLIGVHNSGSDSKEATQREFYGQMFDYYTQRTWIESCVNTGNVTCQNASGKVANMVAVSENKLYLFNNQSLGTLTLGTNTAQDSALPNKVADLNNGSDADAADDILALNTAKQQLRNKISEVENETLVETEWTVESWENLTNKLNAAKAAKDSNDTVALTTALEDLANARADLSAPDYSDLTAAIEAAEALEENDYTVADWEDILDAIDVAKAVQTRSQNEIDAALEDLNAVIEGKEATKLNRMGLKSRIEAIEDRTDENSFTTESWADLQSALQNAKDKYYSRTQQEIEELINSLNDAENALENPNYDELRQLIGEAELLQQGEFSDIVWNALQTAIADAKEVVGDGTGEASRTQAVIDEKKLDLVQAMDPFNGVDRTELRAAVNEAEGIDQNKYTSDSWDAFASVVDEARTVLADDKADQNAINGALADLNEAKEALVALDRTELDAAIKAAEALEENDYTVADWADILNAIETAKGVYRTQGDIADAKTALEAAISAKEKLNRTELDAAIKAAEALENDYTVADWADILNAIETAKGVYRTQDGIADAKTALEAAINAKTKLNREILEDIIALAELYNEQDYTAESWSAFAAAIADAKAKLSSRVQSEINAAVIALNTAAVGLEEVEKNNNEKAPAPSIDYTALQAAINSASALNNTEYTEASWANVEAALVSAKKALTSKNQTEVDAAKANLEAMIAALVKADNADTPADTSADTAEKNSHKKEEKGCGSSIAAGGIILGTVLALGAGVTFKKKED